MGQKRKKQTNKQTNKQKRKNWRQLLFKSLSEQRHRQMCHASLAEYREKILWLIAFHKFTTMIEILTQLV